MFRIDKNFVNLSSGRSVSIDNEAGTADAEGVEQDIPTASAIIDAAVEEAISKAETQAEEILNAARNEAEELMQSAREQAEQAFVRSRSEGFEQGEAEGLEQGRSLYEKKILEDDDKLSKVLEEIYLEKTRMYNDFEDKITALSLDVVRKIINPAEEELGGVFEALVKNALKQIKLTERIVIRVAPAEYERFFASGNAVFDLQAGITVTATVLKDISLSDFDCVIDTEYETINAGLESQLKYLQLAFDSV